VRSLFGAENARRTVNPELKATMNGTRDISFGDPGQHRASSHHKRVQRDAEEAQQPLAEQVT